MLTHAKEQLIRSLHRKKGRLESGLRLVEGKKVIKTAGKAVQWTFLRKDSARFDELVSMKTPQDMAGVAKIPRWSMDNIVSCKTIVVLDGVQDPGNVGAILRLCLGFDASLILVESADVTSPKVVRASVGALFQAPWIVVSREDAFDAILAFDRPVYRLEQGNASALNDHHVPPRVLIAGSEGHGIQLDVLGESISISHNPILESLNVGHALAIVLHGWF